MRLGWRPGLEFRVFHTSLFSFVGRVRELQYGVKSEYKRTLGRIEIRTRAFAVMALV